MSTARKPHEAGAQVGRSRGSGPLIGGYSRASPAMFVREQGLGEEGVHSRQPGDRLARLRASSRSG
ncbi:hypothetical protein IL992_18700 [Microbispora sp. NEAU-D428]|uniref:hypothetical protein n=1 Tax=Microbispora sitophila TaxID=2771537 RepID=UPI001866507A|nr:hypothetical protein [Microbispora sitophila]MBE3011208.1 hypothetical protein [Microbispora sitophila]